jgi:hypothetical protein
LLALCAAGDRAPAQGDPASFVSIQDGRFAVAGRTLSPYWSTLYPSWDRGPRLLRGAAWTGAFSIGTLGYSNFFKESVYYRKFTFAHAADSLQLDRAVCSKAKGPMTKAGAWTTCG